MRANKNHCLLAISIKEIALLVILVFVFSAGCTQENSEKEDRSSKPGQTTKVTVGYLPVSTTLPNWIAKEEGFAQQRGLEIEFKRYANSNLLLMGLLNGEIQATSVCADEPILAAASKGTSGFEIYLQEILTQDSIFDAIIVKMDSSIRTLADLRGKTVACFPGSQLKVYLQIILRQAGIEPNSVNIVQLPPPNMLPSLESRSIDACFALEPVITIGKAKGLTRIVEGSPIAKYIGNGKSICAASFLISSRWADNSPDAADAFVTSVYEAVEIIANSYAKSTRFYPEFTPIPPDIAPQVTITDFATINAPDLDGLQKEADILQDADVIQGNLEINQLLYRWRSDVKNSRNTGD